MKTENLRIGSTDVILMDYEPGAGKIIISNDGYGYNFSYYWGAMGKDTTLAQFICHISTDYFVGKLGPTERGDVDMKATMKNVREWWKNESGIRWYQEMELQKELREAFNRIQNDCCDDRYFVELMQSLEQNFHFPYSKFKSDFEEAIIAMQCEPWNFLVYSDHKHNIWLSKFHAILKEELANLADKKEAA